MLLSIKSPEATVIPIMQKDAKLIIYAGLTFITAFIFPFRLDRQMVRGIIALSEIVGIFVDTPLSADEERDVEYLHAKVRFGEFYDFTGIESFYKASKTSEIHIDKAKMSVDEAAEQIFLFLLEVK